MPFSINNFQSRIGSSGGFSLSYEFEVTVPSIVGTENATSLGAGVADDLKFRIESFTLPPRAVQTFDYITYGPTNKMGGFANYVEAEMNIICSNDLRERFYFMKWQDLVVGNHRLSTGNADDNKKSFDVGYLNDYKSQNIIINKYSNLEGSSGAPLYTCTLVDAFPSVVGGLAMAWDNTEILKMPVTISYRYFLENSPSAEQNTLSNTFT